MQAIRPIKSTYAPYGNVTIIHRDKMGCVKRSHKQAMHSLTNALWLMYSYHMNGQSASTLRMSNGSTLQMHATNILSSEAVGFRTRDINHIQGIIVGTSTTPMQATQWALGSRVPHGEADGSLVASLNVFTVNPTGIILSRTFENFIGPSTISVNEAGLCVAKGATSDHSLEGNMILIARDVLDTQYDIEDGETLTIVYEIEFLTGNRNLHNVWSVFSVNIMDTNSFDRLRTFYRADGTTSSLDYRSIRVDADVGQARGIFLGSGTTQPIFEDIELDELIEYGSGPGQLLYNQCYVHNREGTVSGYSYDVVRSVYNNTEDPITIREMGLFSNTGTVNMGERTLLDRYVLPTPVIISPGEARVARWQFRYWI